MSCRAGIANLPFAAIIIGFSGTAAAQTVEVKGGCVVATAGLSPPLDPFLEQVCGTAVLDSLPGNAFLARYDLLLRGVARRLLSTDSVVCATLRCDARLSAIRLIAYPDSIPTAFELPAQRSNIDLIVTTGLLDLGVAVAATVSTDVSRRSCFQPVFGQPIDCRTFTVSAADSGLLSWLSGIQRSSGMSCAHVPKYPYSFTADSGFVTQDIAQDILDGIVEHELAHAHTQNARCRSTDSTQAAIETSCDSIAAIAMLRGGATPLLSIALFAAMAQLDALFGPLYARFTTVAGNPQVFMRVRDWRRRARAMLKVWRMDDTLLARNLRWQMYSDTLLAEPLPTGCVGSGAWARFEPGPSILASPTSARAGLEGRGLPYTFEGLRQAVMQGWSEIVELYLAAGMNPKENDQTGQGLLVEAVAGACFIGCPSPAARIATIDALLNGGTDVNARDTNGLTVLMWAVARDTSVVDALLRRGADPNAADASGKTVLMYTTTCGCAAARRLLLAHGGRP